VTAARDLRALGIARILLGALVLLRTTPVLAPLHVPYLNGASPLLGWPTSAWHVADAGLALPAGVVATLCVVRTVAAVLFTAGVRTRASGLCAGVAAWIVLAQDATGYINTYNLLFLGLIVLGLSGSGSAWALRAEAEGDPRSGLALARAFVVSVYAWSGIAKLNLAWLRGEVLGQLHAAGVVRGPLADAILASSTGCTVAAWAVAGAELAMGPLLFWPRTRRAAVVAALAFHAALEVSVHPDFFGFAMASLLLAFVGAGSGADVASYRRARSVRDGIRWRRRRSTDGGAASAEATEGAVQLLLLPDAETGEALSIVVIDEPRLIRARGGRRRTDCRVRARVDVARRRRRSGTRRGQQQATRDVHPDGAVGRVQPTVEPRGAPAAGIDPATVHVGLLPHTESCGALAAAVVDGDVRS